MSEHLWTCGDFDRMSWHDSHVHALRVVAGEHGPGQLVLDLDYLLEWQKCTDGSCRFLVLPALLTFIEVTQLRVSLDYQTATAALVPFSIRQIERRVESRGRNQPTLWNISINWPVGEIAFAAEGFEQRGIASPVLCDQQFLSAAERST